MSTIQLNANSEENRSASTPGSFPHQTPESHVAKLGAKPSLSAPALFGEAGILREELQANHDALLERNAWHRQFGYNAEASVRFVLEKARPLRGQVLDIGTGRGRFLLALARCVPQVTTLDIDPEQQRPAWLEAHYANVADRVSFVIADACALPWRADHFDAVLTMNAFHHLTNPARVFNEMQRVLKPGGKLVLADFSPAGFRLMDAIHAAESRRHPHPASRFPHWRARLRAAGFHVRHFVGEHQEVVVGTRR